MIAMLVAVIVCVGRAHVAAAEPAPCEADDCEREQAVGAFLAFGVSGIAGMSRVRSVAPSSGDGWTFQIGLRLQPRLHLVVQVAAIDDDLGYSPDPTLIEDHHAALIGVRWMPFRGRRVVKSPNAPWLISRYFDGAALTVNASLGGVQRDRFTPTTGTATYAPIASAAIGYLPIQGRDWALGMEWREQLERYPEGIQHCYELSFIAQLDL